MINDTMKRRAWCGNDRHYICTHQPATQKLIYIVDCQLVPVHFPLSYATSKHPMVNSRHIIMLVIPTNLFPKEIQRPTPS